MEDKIITVASYPYSRAQLLKSRLEAEGIECFLSNINLLQPDIASGVKIRINEKDADRAMRIIEDIKEEYGKAKQKTIEKLKSVRRILVPVDFSDHSVNACNYALGLAQKLKAEIKLLYAYFNPVISSEPYDEMFSYQVNLDNVVSTLKDEAEEQMKLFTNRLKEWIKKEKISNVKITYELDRGVPEEVILNFSENYKPGVIVLGTRGKGEKGSAIFGSVTKRVIENAKVPVLSIPEKSVYMGIKYMNKVLYATDFDDSDYKAIRKLMTLVRPFGIKIYFVHIASDATNPLDNVKMEELKEHFITEYSDYNVVCDIIEHSDVLQGIEDYIDEKDIDLLALTTHKRRLFERLFNPSITNKMLFHTNIPLLVFHS